LKWIGQHIFEFISRFRNTIYLQNAEPLDPDDHTEIIPDSEGGVTISTVDNSGSNANMRINVDGNFSLDTASGKSTSIASDDINITSTASDKPLLKITSSHTDTDKSAEIRLVKDADNVDDGENLGLISFYGDNDAGTPEVINYASVLAEAADMTDGQEAGKLTLNVAAFDGVLTQGILIDGDTNTNDEVDVTIGSGETSVTTIAGSLHIGVAPSTFAVLDVLGRLQVANQPNITGVGTITSGEWRGTAIASAYLDADTAHYSAQKQLTYYMFKDSLDADKHYVGLQEADAESENSTNKNLPMLAPFAGKLLKVFLRATSDISARTLTWTLETQATGSNTGAAPSVVGTKAGAGCTRQTMTTYDFTTGVTGDNIIDAGDTVQLAVESDSSISDTTYYITCLWEWDLS
tara:strand:+ start:307 stop:1527 length:1221 start_codon:yes stop_codon:yes gene_type:complete